METASNGGVTSPARVAMESTKLLVGGGAEPVTSSTGAPKDYGGAQQLNAAEQENAGTRCHASTGCLGTVLDRSILSPLTLNCRVIQYMRTRVRYDRHLSFVAKILFTPVFRTSDT